MLEYKLQQTGLILHRCIPRGIQPCWHLLKKESFMGLPARCGQKRKKKEKLKPTFELRFSAHDLVIPMGWRGEANAPASSNKRQFNNRPRLWMPALLQHTPSPRYQGNLQIRNPTPACGERPAANSKWTCPDEQPLRPLCLHSPSQAKLLCVSIPYRLKHTWVLR